MLTLLEEELVRRLCETAGDIAGGAGYFDQAHFGHDFRAFTRATPTRYVEVRRRFLREHPVVGPDRGDNRRPPRLRHDGRLGREASERDRPRGRRDTPAGARGLGPRGAVHFVDGVEAAVAKAQELAGDRMVEVAAGDVGGQVFAAGLVDEVRMDVVPVVFGSGKRYF